MNNHSVKQRVSIITLGCTKNKVDSEKMAGYLRTNDFVLEDDPVRADIVIVNTCGFIDAAKEESVNTIIEAAALKEGRKDKKLLVAGCLSERYRGDLKRELPEVDAFFGVTDFEAILGSLKKDYKYELIGERVLSGPKHSAYLKISEGCDNPCSFCAIPLMRGGHVSRPIEEILFEIYGLVRQGVKELVLVAQDSTYYGLDLYGERKLAELLDKISDVQGLEWIRLMYAYPAKFPEDILDVIAAKNNICKYLDIPIQHIADNVLKSMRRGISHRRTVELLDTIRKRVPGIALRTSLIVGYPNETEADFNELLDFVREAEFDRLGVFTYSQEENTTGYVLEDPLPKEVKEERSAMIMEAQREISEEKNAQRMGAIEKVLIDEYSDGVYIGRTERDAPEVDNTVIINSAGELEIGAFYPVKIVDAAEYDLFGEIAG
jgi:ribosomal protein S12 methylthiotransferase